MMHQKLIDAASAISVVSKIGRYEANFKSGNMEYDYEIDAASGTILKHET